MNFAYLGLVGAGLAVLAWGLPAAHRLRTPWNVLAAMVVLVGLVSALLGALLTVVPDFFRS